MTPFVPVMDKKYPLRAAVYDAFRKRSPLISKAKAYEQIAVQFNLSVPTVQRYVRRMESGSMFALPEGRQGRHVYAWSDEALSFFTNFFGFTESHAFKGGLVEIYAFFYDVVIGNDCIGWNRNIFLFFRLARHGDDGAAYDQNGQCSEPDRFPGNSFVFKKRYPLKE